MNKKAKKPRKSNLPNTQRAVKATKNHTPEPEKVVQIGSELTEVHAARFRGPIPPPKIIAEYEEALPGAADRIFAMAELNNALPDKALDYEYKEKLLAKTCAVLVTAMILGLAGFMAYNGAPREAAIIACSTVVAIVSAFLWGPKVKSEQDA